jgi:hypothetical protein
MDLDFTFADQDRHCWQDEMIAGARVAAASSEMSSAFVS